MNHDTKNGKKAQLPVIISGSRPVMFNGQLAHYACLPEMFNGHNGQWAAHNFQITGSGQTGRNDEINLAAGTAQNAPVKFEALPWTALN